MQRPELEEMEVSFKMEPKSCLKIEEFSLKMDESHLKIKENLENLGKIASR